MLSRRRVRKCFATRSQHVILLLSSSPCPGSERLWLPLYFTKLFKGNLLAKLGSRVSLLELKLNYATFTSSCWSNGAYYHQHSSPPSLSMWFAPKPGNSFGHRFRRRKQQWILPVFRVEPTKSSVSICSCVWLGSALPRPCSNTEYEGYITLYWFSHGNYKRQK